MRLSSAWQVDRAAYRRSPIAVAPSNRSTEFLPHLFPRLLSRVFGKTIVTIMAQPSASFSLLTP